MSKIRLSKRLPKDLTPSPFFEELEKTKAQVLAEIACTSDGCAAPLIDMTVSSPVRVGLPVPLDNATEQARSQFGHWSPDASGWKESREAVAKYYRDRGGVFTAGQILVTASTSEAYSVIFKTFCNPGDAILTPIPGYPLLDTLAQLEHLECAPYFLKLVREKKRLKTLRSMREKMNAKSQLGDCKEESFVANNASDTELRGETISKFGAERPQTSFRFCIDTDSLLTVPENARIMLLVSPHNPTGHVVSLQEWNEIVRFCEDNNLILVVDEVFGDYTFCETVKRSWNYLKRENDQRPTDEQQKSDDYFDCGGGDFVFAPQNGPKCPIIWLNGLSKAVGSPQLKFGWMTLYAPREHFEAIRAALEFVEDAYLSASSCAQSLAVPLLETAAGYESQVLERLKANWNVLCDAFPRKYCPEVLGGWYAVVHLGDDDEEITLRLLREKHVLVQPGFFFDFEDDGWVVMSLLQEPKIFAEAIKRIQTNF